MNTDHKIFTKILANRLKPVLQYLIGQHQSGYLENRFIGNNIRNMIDIIEYCDREQINAIMISIDFEKCFDNIEFTAIEGALQYFGFGQNFIQMVKLLYCQFKTAVVHNGEITDFMNPTRAIHQGCAVSGYIFLLNAEILATLIQNNKDIKCIPIDGTTIDPVSQFVDDMCLFMMVDARSLEIISKSWKILKIKQA